MSNSKRLNCDVFDISMLLNHIVLLITFCKTVGRSFVSNTSIFAMLGFFSVNSHAQQDGEGLSGVNLRITPRVSISESYSDNINLSSINRQSEFTTEVSSGINISSKSGRLKGDFDYSLTQLLYARNSDKNGLQNSMNANGKYEVVDNWLFLDFGGTIAQQSVSAFGAQSIDGLSINSNRTEVATYRISPNIRGRFMNFADYEVRYGYETTRSKSSLISDVETKESSIKLNGDRFFSDFRWTADFVGQSINYSTARDIASDRLNLSLIYSISPRLDAILLAGRENSNYVSVNKEGHNSHGVGLNWSPSEMTRVFAQFENRYFGNTRNISVLYRTPRTAWSYSNAESLVSSTNSANSNGSAALNTLYNFYYNQFSAYESDPVVIAALVQSVLQTSGLSSYLAATLLLQRTQTMTFTLSGVRDTISFSASKGTNQSLSNASSGGGDFSITDFIRQNGFSINLSHKLTVESSVNFLLSQQKIVGNSTSLETKLRSFGINLMTRFSDKIYGNFGARHTISDGSSYFYKENSLSGSVNIQF